MEEKKFQILEKFLGIKNFKKEIKQAWLRLLKYEIFLGTGLKILKKDRKHVWLELLKYEIFWDAIYAVSIIYEIFWGMGSKILKKYVENRFD